MAECFLHTNISCGLTNGMYKHKSNQNRTWNTYIQIRHIWATRLKYKSNSCPDVSLCSLIWSSLLIFPLDLPDKIPFLFSLKCILLDNPPTRIQIITNTGSTRANIAEKTIYGCSVTSAVWFIIDYGKIVSGRLGQHGTVHMEAQIISSASRSKLMYI